jgi:hypothetical protein
MGAESVAYAKIGQAMGKYSDTMNTLANNEYQTGQQMVQIVNVMTAIQYATVAIGILSLPLAAAPAYVAGGAGATGALSAAASGLSGVAQASQTALGSALSALQTAKSEVQAKQEFQSTALQGYEKLAQNNGNTIKAESQGAGKVGAAINTMLMNEGAIERQKIKK